MATSVYEVVDVTLLDGTELSVRPLKISILREFMKKFEKLTDVADDNMKSMDVLLDCVVTAMKQYNPELASKEKLEDVIDLPTVYKIIEVASGIKFGADNPNLMAQVGLS
jgi:inhibitor of KinA sporulation pathway (predicted exonuclease)